MKTFYGTKPAFIGTPNNEIHVCIEKVSLSDRKINHLSSIVNSVDVDSKSLYDVDFENDSF